MSARATAEKLISGDNYEKPLNDLLIKYITSKDYKNFSETFNVINELRVTTSIMAPIVKKCLDTVSSKLTKSDDRVDFYNPLIQYMETVPSFAKDLQDLTKLFIDECNKSKRYIDLGNFYMRQPMEEEWVTSQKLEYHVKIGETFIKGHAVDAAASQLNQAQKYFFRLATSKTLVERYDNLRALVSAEKGDYPNASIAFMNLADAAKDEKKINSYLHNAIIYAILTNAGPKRQSIFGRLKSDDRTTSIDVYPLLDRFSHAQLVMKSDLEQFKEFISHAPGYNESNFTQAVNYHNLSIVSMLFTAISLKRLAEIIGTKVDDVVKMMRTMIETKRVDAQIDQPNGMIIYSPTKSASEIKDESIEKFCVTVSQVARSISKK